VKKNFNTICYLSFSLVIFNLSSANGSDGFEKNQKAVCIESAAGDTSCSAMRIDLAKEEKRQLARFYSVAQKLPPEELAQRLGANMMLSAMIENQEDPLTPMNFSSNRFRCLSPEEDRPITSALKKINVHVVGQLCETYTDSGKLVYLQMPQPKTYDLALAPKLLEAIMNTGDMRLLINQKNLSYKSRSELVVYKLNSGESFAYYFPKFKVLETPIFPELNSGYQEVSFELSSHLNGLLERNDQDLIGQMTTEKINSLAKKINQRAVDLWYQSRN
jgi:hypothetical protein